MSENVSGDETLVRSASVLSSPFESGIMMMDIEGGTYFQVDATGARIWDLLEEPIRFDALCEALVAEFDVDPQTCRRDAAAFVRKLREHGLVDASG